MARSKKPSKTDAETPEAENAATEAVQEDMAQEDAEAAPTTEAEVEAAPEETPADDGGTSAAEDTVAADAADETLVEEDQTDGEPADAAAETSAEGQDDSDNDPWEDLGKDAETTEEDASAEAATSESTNDVPPASPPPAEPEPRSAWPMVISGIVIAALGYIAGRGDVIDNFLPGAWRSADPVEAIAPQIAELSEQTASVSADLSALTDKVEAIPAPEAPDFSPIVNQIHELRGRLQTLEDTPPPAPIITTDGTDLSPINSALQQISARLTTLEEQDQDYAADFDALQTTAKAQQEQIAALLDANERAESDAQAAANETRAREALGRIRAALDAGQPFAGDLDAFAETGIAEIPAALSEVAADGVITLGALQVAVEDASRTALAAARDSESATSGLGGFFERQLGVRSLEAREGDDPDAVLSRVVAMMKNGDLQKALSEAELLPDVSREAMSGWLNTAQTRANALTAAADLSASLPTN